MVTTKSSNKVAQSTLKVTVAAAALGIAGLGLAAYALSQRRQARRPFSYAEFQDFIDPRTGLIVNIKSLLELISTRGLDHSLKAELWPLLLGLRRPTSTTEQLDAQYRQLRQQYLDCLACCKSLAASVEDSIYHAAQQHTFGTPSAADMPHELAQFSQAQRIIIMDAIRTDFEKHAAASHPPATTSPRSHLSSAYAQHHYDAVLSNTHQHATIWLSNASREVLESSPHLSIINKYQSARLISILLAYAAHDPDTGYCQGMSDLLVPILLLVEDDVLAYACFCQLMRIARKNFAVDESGITAQLQALSALLQRCDPPLHHKLRQLGASHMHFAYRMLVVLLRRDLPAPQVELLWEMMWAEQLLQGGGISRPAASLGPSAAMVAAAAAGGGGAGDAVQQHPAAEDTVAGTAEASEAGGSGAPSLLLCFVAAAVMSQRRKVLDECRECDDVLRLYSCARLDFHSCLRKAQDIRSRQLQA